MRIVICIKQVPDISTYIEIDPMSGLVDRDDLVYVVNPFDLVAVEEGLRIKEAIGDARISIISLGPLRVKEALRACLAMGPIDEAIHLHDRAFEKLDKYSLSLVLAKAIETMSYDIILCGKLSVDDNDGQVGAIISQLLTINQVSDISKLEIGSDHKKVSVHRVLEKGDVEIVECRLPALFTVNLTINTPRYPSFPDSLNALTKEIQELNAQSLKVKADIFRHKPYIEVQNISFPKPRPRNILLPDSNLPVHERLDFIMAGGISGRNNEWLEGDPKEIASKTINIFLKNKII